MSEERKKSKRNIIPFNGEKYAIWKFRIRAAIAEEDALCVLDKEVPKDITEVWKKAERVAKGIIIENLSDSMIGFATEKDSAKDILKKLDDIYDRKSLATQLAVEKKLLSMKLKADTPLSKHFMSFDEMIVELESAGETLNETSKVARLLLTLPGAYDSVVTAIQTLSDDKLSLAFVKTRLLDYEIKLKNEQNDTSGKALQTATQLQETVQHKQNKETERKIKNPRQNFKHKKFNKNFRGLNYRKNSNFKKGNNRVQVCDHCGRKNHEIKDCYFYKRMTQNADKRQRTIQTVQIEDNPEKFVWMAGASFKSSNFSNETDKSTFILDSGATDHLINQEDIFAAADDLEVPINITIAKKNETIAATKKGIIEVTTDQGVEGALDNVLYAPELPHNLLSVPRIQEAGMRVIFKEYGGVRVEKGGKLIATGKSLNKLSYVEFGIRKKMCNQANVKENTSYKIWHERLGHIEKSKFLEIKRNDLILDNKKLETVNPTDELCEACVYGKQARLPFSKNRDRSHVTRPLFIVHSDVCGPITPATIDGKTYFVTFTDEYTHYTVVYLIEQKSDTFRVFQDFVNKSETHFNLKLAHLNCDNGREYLSNEFKAFCVQRGIQYHLTVPYTPQQNAIAERMNRTLVEKARAMVHGACLGKDMWGEAVLTAAYLINLTPTKAIKENKTPYELWHSRKPKLNHLKIFGSTVYVHDKTRKGKFDKKSFKGILVGYELNGYKVLNIETNKFIVARDVIIDELNFKISRPLVHTEEAEFENSNIKRQKIDDKIELSNDKESNVRKSVTETDKTNKESLDDSNSQTDVNETEPRRSARIKNKPSISYEELCYQISAQSAINDIPKSFVEIKDRDDRSKWEKAIKDEIDSLIQNETWDIIDCPVGKNIVDCKWVFAIKNDSQGNPTKYKARLVAKGYSQQYQSDYYETFAPVARITTFRLLLAFANQHDLLIHQMDVKTAFLNGSLNEEIFMRIPEGIKSDENHVCKLKKALYGLKQSARCWFQRFDEVLKEHGFTNSSVDRCLYILDRGHITKNIYVLLYVDDVVIITFEEITMINFKNYLMKKFSMIDMKEIKFFLGIRIERKNNIVTLDQSSYLKTVLQKFNMSDCNAISTPLPVKLNYDELNSDTFYDAPCKNLIGCLMYAMLCTRPDLCTALNLLSRYQVKNNKELWQCLKRVLRYIKGTVELKLTFEKTNYKELLVGYVDSDWAGNEIDRKSTTGYLFKVFDLNTICWNTKRQNSVATSSTEAEYMALYEGIKEACWLKSLLLSIKLKLSKPILIFEDNNGCIAIANNPTDHKRSKHIDIKYHFSREKVEQKEVIIEYISTDNQLADIFTKSLPAVQFLKCRKQIGLQES